MFSTFLVLLPTMGDGGSRCRMEEDDAGVGDRIRIGCEGSAKMLLGCWISIESRVEKPKLQLEEEALRRLEAASLQI